MMNLGDLNLRKLQRGKCLGVLLGRFEEFLLGRGSGVSENYQRANERSGVAEMMFNKQD